MTLAGGKYLSFLDADDFFERDMLRLAFENAEREQADIVIFRGDRYDDTLEKYIQMNYSIKSAQLPGKNPFSFHDIPYRIFTFAVGWAWDKLYLRAFVEQERLRFQNLRTSNDSVSYTHLDVYKRQVQMHPTIVAHTIMPVFFVALAYAVYVLLGQKLFRGDTRSTGMFLCFLSLIHVFSYYSVYTQGTFMPVSYTHLDVYKRQG